MPNYYEKRSPSFTVPRRGIRKLVIYAVFGIFLVFLAFEFLRGSLQSLENEPQKHYLNKFWKKQPISSESLADIGNALSLKEKEPMAKPRELRAKDIAVVTV